nr:stalk domain-containing protein [uncultured Aminipila sp.]
MMNKRLSQLCCELKIDSIDIEEKVNIKDIIDKVNGTLNTDINERKVYRRQKLVKTVVIITALLILATTTVFAVVKADILKLNFTGDTTPFTNFVDTKKQSVADGQYKLTLEQTLVSKYQVFVVYTVEGLTDEAIAKLMKEDYFGVGLTEISFEPKYGDHATISNITQGEIIELKTKTSRTFQLYSSSYFNEDDVDFILRFACMKEGKQITVPMKCNVESKEFILEGQPYGNAILRYSPLGIYFERNYKTQNEMDAELYFRMKNGKIKTCNDLADVLPGGRMNSYDVFDEQLKLWRYGSTGLFYEITELSAFRSIIVGNIEYDIRDTTKTKTITIDETLRPFELKPVIKDETTWIPVEALCSKLGAKYQWNEKTRSAKINYHDEIYILKDGSSVLLKNGEEFELFNPVCILKGQLIAPEYLAFGMHFKVKPKEEPWESSERRCIGTYDIKNTVWIVTP